MTVDKLGNITIAVRHSKEEPPAMVEKTRDLRLQELEIIARRQHRWASKAQAKDTADASSDVDAGSDAAQPSKRSQKRARQKQQRQARQAEQDAKVQELQARLQGALDGAFHYTGEALLDVAGKACDELSKLAAAKAAAGEGAALARHAVLEPQGEPRNVTALAGTVGAVLGDEDYGSIVVSSFRGERVDKTLACFDKLCVRLLARAAAPAFGGASAQPCFGSASAAPAAPMRV